MGKAYRTYVLMMLMLTYAFNISDRMIMSILMEDIKAEFTLTDTQMGLLAGLAFTAFYVVLGIPIARFADKSNRKNIVAGAVALWSAMTSLCALATGFGSLFLIRLGVGVGEAGGTPPASSMIADYFDRHELARAMGIFSVGGTLGTAVGLIGGGYLADQIGWRMTFVALGLPGVLLGLLIFFTVKEPKRGQFSGDTESSKTIWDALAALAKNKVYIWTLLANGCVMTVAYAFAIWLSPIILRNTDLSTANVGLYVGLVTIAGGIPGMIGGGYVADALIHRNARWRAWVPAIVSLTALPFLVLSLRQESLPLLFGLYVIGYALMMMTQGPALALIQAHARPSERALASSLNSFVATGLGYGLGPFLTGVMSDMWQPTHAGQSLGLAVLVMSLMLLPGAALYWLTARAMKAEPTP